MLLSLGLASPESLLQSANLCTVLWGLFLCNFHSPQPIGMARESALLGWKSLCCLTILSNRGDLRGKEKKPLG